MPGDYFFNGGPAFPAASTPIIEPLNVSLLICKTLATGRSQVFFPIVLNGLFNVALTKSPDELLKYLH